MFKELDTDILVKYVSLAAATERDIYEEVRDLLVRPKPRTTLCSYANKPTENQFHERPRPLTRRETRKLLGAAMALGVRAVMSHHFFKIGGKTYRQRDGGAIGMDLTVELAAIYMLEWDSKFLSKCLYLGIRIPLYKRYVDDVFTAMKSIKGDIGINERGNRLVTVVETQEGGEEEDARTMGILKKIANSLDENIRMETEVPSSSQGGKMPVLDVKVWPEAEVILYDFYKKPVASPFTILYRSAVSAQIKRSTALMEGLRRMRNISDRLDKGYRVECLKKYMDTLRVSGYDEKYRGEVLEGVKKLDNIERMKVANGDRKRYRSGAEIARDKSGKPGGHIDTWYLALGYTNIMKVQHSEDGTIREKVMKAMEKVRSPDGGKLKIVEKVGQSIVAGLKRNDPYKTNRCPYPSKCQSNEETDCTQKGTVYQVQCLLCPGTSSQDSQEEEGGDSSGELTEGDSGDEADFGGTVAANGGTEEDSSDEADFGGTLAANGGDSGGTYTVVTEGDSMEDVSGEHTGGAATLGDFPGAQCMWGFPM